MTTYILVHGAWHGGWCWHRIVAQLQRASHHVVAPDLNSLGRDRTPPEGIKLETWTEQIAALVQAQAEPVVLVGHSRGGIVLSTVAEQLPDKVRTLVYLTAFLVENGRSLRETAAEDPHSLVGAAMQVAPDHLTASVREELVREAFYGQCTDADVALAKSLLVPEPLAPLAARLRLSQERFGRVPRVYIECTQDRAITLAAQRRMQAALPCRERITLDSDHSPFFSHAEQLADVLLKI